MEENKHILSKALQQLPEHLPEAKLWVSIQQKLQEGRLNDALQNLPLYEPAPATWESISAGITRKRNAFTWWSAASVLLIAGVAAAWLFSQHLGQRIAFSQDVADLRLQPGGQPNTDLAYQKLLIYCQTETFVCEKKEYKLLKDEYEKLEMASEQLHNAMGNFNSEPELVRQFDNVEQQKAAILNEMAKMI
jgi:hypothetical protein